MRSTADRAAVWTVDVSSLSAADVARCEEVNGPEEREQTRRFQFDADRDAYRAAHGLARMALSSFEPSVSPREWAFDSTSHGRPEVVPGLNFSRLRFNISHTRGVVACLVTRDLDCGVDVESIDRARNLDHLAGTILAPIESTAFEASADADRALLLSRYWTLKEAFSKAIGLGMSIPFETIPFELQEGRARVLNYSDDWRFEQWSPSANYIAATAVRAPSPVGITRHRGLPPS